jgi:methylphosphotriester-DNA--protein-cysteine methyltransferase
VTVEYEEQRPSRELAPFVEARWWMRASGPDAAVESVLPDGCLELVLHLGDPFAAGPDARRLERQPEAVVVGQLTRRLFLRRGARAETMGIRFRPGGAWPFVGPCVDELTGRAVRVADLWGGSGRELWERVAAAGARPAQASAAESWLLRRMNSAAAPDRAVEAAVRALRARRGALAVSEMAAHCGLGPRQLERRFRARVGLAPKALARVLRFQGVLEAAGRGGQAWVSLALDHGYFDQPHLVRDFRQLGGESPTRLLSGLGDFGRAFVAPARLAALFAPHADDRD